MNNKNFEDISSPNVVKKNNRNKKLKMAFGKGEMNIAALPAATFSNVKIAGVFHIKEKGGCSICFPHGPETTNATNKKNKRSWKNRRRRQYKSF